MARQVDTSIRLHITTSTSTVRLATNDAGRQCHHVSFLSYLSFHPHLSLSFFHLRPAGATCGQQSYGPILWIIFTRCTRETWKLAIGGESIDTKRYLAGLPMERKYDIAKGKKKKFVFFRRPSRHGLGRSCIILEAAGLRQRKFLKDG